MREADLGLLVQASVSVTRPEETGQTRLGDVKTSLKGLSQSYRQGVRKPPRVQLFSSEGLRVEEQGTARWTEGRCWVRTSCQERAAMFV